MSQTLSVAPEKMIRSICLLLVFGCVLTTGYAPSCPAGCPTDDDVEELHKEVEKLDKKVDKNNKILKDLKRKEERKSAITVALEAEGHYSNEDPSRILIYDKVITDLAYDYNTKTGNFTARYPGVHVFIFFYHAGKEWPVRLFLNRNNEKIVASTDQKTKGDNSDNGGNAAVLDLEKGDKVSVSLGEFTHVWGSTHRQTTLSAFLLYPD